MAYVFSTHIFYVGVVSQVVRSSASPLCEICFLMFNFLHFKQITSPDCAQRLGATIINF